MFIKSVITSLLCLSICHGAPSHKYVNKFEQNKVQYPQGVFNRPSQDLNTILKSWKSKAQLSSNEAFDAEYLKAFDPGQYIPHAVAKSVTKDFYRSQDGHLHFTRISLQKDFRDPSVYVFVKEFVTIDMKGKQVIFLGMPVENSDIQFLNVKNLTKYSMAKTKPPLFDVRHAIFTPKGSPEDVYDEWTLVRHVNAEIESPEIMENIKSGATEERIKKSIIGIYGTYFERKYGSKNK